MAGSERFGTGVPNLLYQTAGLVAGGTVDPEPNGCTGGSEKAGPLPQHRPPSSNFLGQLSAPMMSR